LKNNFKEKEMKNKIFGLAPAIARSMIAGGGGALWAQGMGVTGWSSPQSTATQGRIRSAADDFIRPDSYTSARIENWFAMTSFQSGNVAHLGYAKKLEKAYIGVYYGGSFWANITPFAYTEAEDANWPGGKKTVPTYTDLDFTTPGPSNRVAVLLGVADMGFRLSYYTTHESVNKKDLIVGTTQYSSYKADTGVISPQLAWSMTKNLTEKGVKPYVTVDLNFNRDYQKYEVAATNSQGEYIDHSDNSFQPILQVGLGGYTFYTKEAFRLSADFEYRLTPTIYSNEYSYLDGTKYKIEKIKGRNRTAGLSENSGASNLITPYLAAQWGDGPVALRGRLQLPVTINSTKTTGMILDANNKLVQDGADSKTTTVGFNPSLQLALQWRPITKLAINAGGLIGLGTLSRTTVESTRYTNDKEDDGASSERITPSYGATSTNLFLGATFNPTDNLAFEAVVGGTTSTSGVSTGNRLNVFDSSGNGMFNFGSILVSLKF
jgi:hypothetical protein